MKTAHQHMAGAWQQLSWQRLQASFTDQHFFLPSQHDDGLSVALAFSQVHVSPHAQAAPHLHAHSFVAAHVQPSPHVQSLPLWHSHLLDILLNIN